MSWATFEQTRRSLPGLWPRVERVVSALRKYRDDAAVDPRVLGHATGVDDVALIAILNLLRENGLGDFQVAVVDDLGQIIRRFPDEDSVPNEVQDDFGDSIEVEPRNLRLVFTPHLSLH